MERIEKHLNLHFLLALPVLAALATILIVSNQLPNGTVTGKYFWFYGVIVIISASVFIYCLFEQKTFHFTLQDFCVLLFCISGFAVTWSHNNALSNKSVILLLILPLYFCVRYTLQNNRKIRNFLLFFLLITGLTEAIWGLTQLYGLSPSYHNLYPISDSLFNPGPYAGYLAINSPIAAYYCLCDSRIYQCKWERRYLPFYIRGGLSAVTLISIIVILPSTMSRAAWIAAASGIALMFGVYYHRKKNFS